MTPKTRRETHLFPAEEHGEYRISLQGSSGHHSVPRKDLEHLEDYEAVEVVVYGPAAEDGGMLTPQDLERIGLPKQLCDKFDPIGIGPCLSWAEVAAIRDRLDELAAEPPPPSFG